MQEQPEGGMVSPKILHRISNKRHTQVFAPSNRENRGLLTSVFTVAGEVHFAWTLSLSGELVKVTVPKPSPASVDPFGAGDKAVL